MKVRDVMTSDVVTVHPRSSFKQTAERMLSRNVSGLPVVINDGELVGIVTEADLISKEAFDERLGPIEALFGFLSGDRRWSGKASGVTAGDVMTSEVVVVGPDDDVRAAARLMLRDGVKRLPVVDGGRLVGIVSRHDLLGIFHRDDAAIRDELEARLLDRSVAPSHHRVSVVVVNGVVTLQGSVRYQSDRAAVMALATGVPGVIGIKDALVWERDAPGLAGDDHRPGRDLRPCTAERRRP